MKMKRVILGKVYDTSSAKLVGTWVNDSPVPDDVQVQLFRKKTGEYFLYRVYGTGTQEIAPVSFQSADDWAVGHLEGDEYESEFGKPADDDAQVVVSYRISAWAKAAIDRASRSTGETQGQVIDRLAGML